MQEDAGLTLSDDIWLDEGEGIEFIDDKFPRFSPIEASLIFAAE